MRRIKRNGENPKRACLMCEPKRYRRRGEQGPDAQYNLKADRRKNQPSTRLKACFARRNPEPYRARPNKIGAEAMIELRRRDGLKKIIEARGAREIPVGENFSIH